MRASRRSACHDPSTFLLTEDDKRQHLSDNPYAFGGAVPATQAPADARATFLRKVYSLLLAGILAFAGTLWAAANVQPVHDIAMGLWRTIYGAGGFGWILYMAIMMGGFFVVRAVATVKPLNLITYFGWSFLLALLTAPLVLGAAEAVPVSSPRPAR